MALCSGEYRGAPSIKAFRHYVISRTLRETEQLAFRIYVTDSIYLRDVKNQAIAKRWYDLIQKPDPPMTKEKATRVASDIIKKAGIIVT